MTLLITVFAACISTAVWYKSADRKEMCFGTLCWLYWGASIMWFVDAVFEYTKKGAEYFTPATDDMLNDSFLGLAVLALGMIVWIAVLLIKDPKGVVRSSLFKA